MTQLTVTLDNGVDVSLVKKFIESIRGVLHTSLLSQDKKEETASLSKPEWVTDLSKSFAQICPDDIDMDDERTKYIMSK